VGRKLSFTKIKRIIQLYLKGYNQTEISKMLHIDQSTVSKYIGKFKALSEQKGIDAALKEFEIKEDELEETQSIVAEFKKSDITIADVEVALQIEKVLQQCNIKHEDYIDFIKVGKKTKDAGYLNAAIKLNQLENKTGMDYEEIVAKSGKTYEQLKKSQQELEKLIVAIKTSKAELVEINKKKKKASDDLKKHMQQIGVDEKSLKKVEHLALALKDAAIPEKELPEYIQRQEALNKAGISINIFNEVLEKVKVATKADNGKLLLSLFTQFGGLAKVVSEFQSKKQLLTKEVGDLEQKDQFKSKLDNEVNKLKAEKADLESSVAEFHKKKDELDYIQSQIASLIKNKAELEHEVATQEEHSNALTEEIKPKQQKVSDLSQLEAERDTLLSGIAEIEAKFNYEKSRLQVFDAFLGVVDSSSIASLEKFVVGLPALLDLVKQGKYSPELLRTYILKTLTADTLQVLKCQSCGAMFSVDKPAGLYGYYCPCCYPPVRAIIDQGTLTILKKALAELKPQVKITTLIPPKPKQPGPGEQDEAFHPPAPG